MFDNWDDTTEVCPDLAKLNHFSQILEAVGYILRAYFARCKIMNLDVYAFWQIIIHVSSQFFENILAVWSHWIQPFISFHSRDIYNTNNQI